LSFLTFADRASTRLVCDGYSTMHDLHMTSRDSSTSQC